MRNMSISFYFNHHNSSRKPKNNMHFINIKGAKKIWAPKDKKLNYDVDMLDRPNSNFHLDIGCSNHMTEEINMLFYFTPMRGKISSYDNNKCESVGYETNGKSHKFTVELFW